MASIAFAKEKKFSLSLLVAIEGKPSRDATDDRAPSVEHDFAEGVHQR